MGASREELAPPEGPPEVGALVQVRSRRWVVEHVEEGQADESPIVRLACADDDAQGLVLDVFWDHEPDRVILKEAGWQDLVERGFDPPDRFAAYYHTLRWNCVTATSPDLFQSPFRAGIRIDAYQMEPLRKALRMPRASLFLADDTGLGKTIEAGLIARELLLRRKAKTIVVAAPPSMLDQWRSEMEERFGLLFVIVDRAYVAKVRRERGFGVNPWRTHSRFLVSHNLLVDPAYTDPMREWLGPFLPGSLLILDEAHHAAPATGGRYGIETKFTRAVRDLAWRFEHRIFLSATPHNGHSRSFATLMEILDPYRFTRGVKIRPKALGDVMVRRLKEDLRALQGGFPERQVVRIVLDDLPEDAPELLLSRLLDEYRSVREERFAFAPRRAQTAASLLVVGLQQRLLSSIEAFARSLKVHRKTLEKQRGAGSDQRAPQASLEQTLTFPPDADDERATWQPDELEAHEAAEVEAASCEAEVHAPQDDRALALQRREMEILDRMQEIAERARGLPDAKVRYLIRWIRDNLCPGLPAFGERPQGDPPRWLDRRVLLFTENREGTKRYLFEMLRTAIAWTDRPDERIEVIDGLTSSTRRREIQRRFNTPPAEDPLRILIATDAAREGLNFQAHCADLFHFDLPWNPARIEQRNGRIDRKLQPSPVVRCHYFVLPQRAEDHVLDVLVRKTDTIKRELGSLAKVLEEPVDRLLRSGIRHRDVASLVEEIERSDLSKPEKQAIEEDLAEARQRQEALEAQIEVCRNLLEKAREYARFDSDTFREVLSCSLEMLGADRLRETTGPGGRPAYCFPALDRLGATDPSWSATLDSLRVPMRPGQKVAEWRREAPIRPVVFQDPGVVTEDVVQLHLEHRVVQRLLARFKAQGFVYRDLSRACLTTTEDPIPRVVFLGRLTLYGRGAERLHEEVVMVAARWMDPALRKGPLKPSGEKDEAEARKSLEDALRRPSMARMPNEAVQRRLLQAAMRDIEELRPHLEARAQAARETAERRLRERGEREAENLRAEVEQQQARVRKELARYLEEARQGELFLHLDPEERRQREADVKAWSERLNQFERDLVEEPARIRDFYAVRAARLEPVGLVYLWPETN